MDKKTPLKVKILFKKLIKPSVKTPDHLRIYKLSAIDRSSPARHIPHLFFYPAMDNIDEAILARRLENLEKSLSESLNCCYPLAGRLSADALSIDCQGQGVLYMIAKADRRFNQFMDEASKDIDLLSYVVPQSVVVDQDSFSGPLVRVLVCIFECGGMVLTLDTHHFIADAFTASALIDSWAKMSRCGASETKLQSFDLSGIWPPFEMSTKAPLRPLAYRGEKLVAKRLFFDGATIQNLKDQVKARAPDMDGQPTRVEVVSAFTWSGLIRAAQARHGYLRPSALSLIVNLRGRLAVKVPENALGNVYVPFVIKFMADERRTELHFFVRLIRETIRGKMQEFARASKDELYSLSIRAHEEVREWFIKDEVDTLISSSLLRFPYYEADFGWGKPCLMSLIKSGVPTFYILNTNSGKGLEVLLTLNETEMQKLESDPSMAPLFSQRIRTSKM